jgi:hypothetical protein
VWDQQVAVRGEAIPVNPTPAECSSITGGGHVPSLGNVSVAPGRYQFEFEFSETVKEPMNFPMELTMLCCGRSARTGLGGLALFFGTYGILVVVLATAFFSLMLIGRLFIHTGILVYLRRSK